MIGLLAFMAVTLEPVGRGKQSGGAPNNSLPLSLGQGSGESILRVEPGLGIRQQMQETMDNRVLGEACEGAISGRSARSGQAVSTSSGQPSGPKTDYEGISSAREAGFLCL